MIWFLLLLIVLTVIFTLSRPTNRSANPLAAILPATTDPLCEKTASSQRTFVQSQTNDHST